MSSNGDNIEETLRVNKSTPLPEPTISGKPAQTSQPSFVFDTLNFSSTVPLQDLSSDKLLLAAPRIASDKGQLPTLSGIPLLAKLGQGGMGAVYLGFHQRLNKEVAVKVLPFSMADQSPDTVKRFYREAQLAAKIQSPHLVNVFDVNEENGLFFIVMEFIAGQSAAGCLKSAKQNGQIGLDLDVAMSICIAACEGLAAAHEQDIIHRDVKPDNILIPTNNAGQLLYGKAKLADLGLARGEESDQFITASQAAMGTPGYMPPEQAKSARNATASADVFAMGATLYALLAGHAPFTGESAMDVLLATLQKPHKPLRELRPDVPAAISDLIDVSLAKKPEHRYPTATLLLEAIKECRSAPARTKVADVAPTLVQTAHSKKTALKRKAENTAKPKTSPVVFAALGALVIGVLAIPLILRNNSSEAPTASSKSVPDPVRVTEPAKATPVQSTQVQTTLPREITLKLGTNVALEMVLIPEGEFLMGSPDGEKGREQSEGPQRKVKISKPFYMGKYEVTQEQWVAVMSENPSSNKDKPQHPVENVSWFDAREFIKRSKQPIALPTEAQWEWACRAGTTSRFHSGDDIGSLNSVAWVGRNESNATSPVGLKLPNNFGLYDMHGNVWEWCDDSFAPYPPTGETDPVQREGPTRVMRGGSWRHPPEGCRSAYRRGNAPEGGGNIYAYGFRVVAPTTIATSSGQTVDTSKPILDAPKLPSEQTVDLGGSFKLKLVLVPAGEFEMGSDSRGNDEKPLHKVSITKPYYIGKYEVTKGQYQAFADASLYRTGAEVGGMGFSAVDGDWQERPGISWRSPGFTQEPSHPVCVVNFYDAEAFCAWASWKSGRVVRLPTEAEWEYAARGTTKFLFPFGNTWEAKSSGNTADSSLRSAGFGMRFGTTEGNDEFPFTAPVGSFPKALSWCGTADQSGNVWEWTSDRHRGSYGSAASGSQRPIRGGSWSHDAARHCAVSSRKGHDPAHCSAAVGFRVVVENQADSEWTKKLEGMTLEDRARAAADKVVGLSGHPTAQYKLEKKEDRITLNFSGFGLRDLSPLRNIREPITLLLAGSRETVELTPLSGMCFDGLSLYESGVTDLKPLRYTCVGWLDISKTKVKDLSPLAGKIISYFSIGDTELTDISPLKTCRIKKLFSKGAKVKDWSPLLSAEVEELHGDWDLERDRAFLNSLPKLKIVNEQPFERK